MLQRKDLAYFVIVANTDDEAPDIASIGIFHAMGCPALSFPIKDPVKAMPDGVSQVNVVERRANSGFNRIVPPLKQ